jgi:hypothetical protein
MSLLTGPVFLTVTPIKGGFEIDVQNSDMDTPIADQVLEAANQALQKLFWKRKARD